MMRHGLMPFVLYLVLVSAGSLVRAQPACATELSDEGGEVETTATALPVPSAEGNPASENRSQRQSTIALYGWITGVNADIRAGPVEAEIDASFSDILDNLDTGFMLYYEALEENTGFYVDVFHARVSNEIGERLLTVDYKVKQNLIEAGALLRQGAPDKGVCVIIGVRYMDIDAEVGLTPPGVRVASGEHWLDPVAGVRYRAVLSDKWTFSGRGDIGGFGFGTDFSWQLIGVFRYQMSPRWSLALGYRHLDIDYDESDFAFDGSMSGPLVGFAYGL